MGAKEYYKVTSKLIQEILGEGKTQARSSRELRRRQALCGVSGREYLPKVEISRLGIGWVASSELGIFTLRGRAWPSASKGPDPAIRLFSG